jgi:hypothetical protein
MTATKSKTPRKAANLAGALADTRFRYYTEIQKFGGFMLRELMANNEKKGDFLKWYPAWDDAKSEMEHHVIKLMRAIDKGDHRLITEFCADIANTAMGIHRSLGVPDNEKKT